VDFISFVAHPHNNMNTEALAASAHLDKDRRKNPAAVPFGIAFFFMQIPF
jgi:hypothetical protein